MLIHSEGSIAFILVSPRASSTFGDLITSLFRLNTNFGVEEGDKFWGKNLEVEDLNKVFLTSEKPSQVDCKEGNETTGDVCLERSIYKSLFCNWETRFLWVETFLSILTGLLFVYTRFT